MKDYYYGFIGALVLSIIVVAISLSSGSASVEKTHFDNGEISFDCPSQWQQINAYESQLVAFEDPKSGIKLTVSRQVPPKDWTHGENFTISLSQSADFGLKLLAQDKININGNDAYQNTYELKSNNTTIHIREVWLEKNGAIYSIITTSPPGGWKDLLGTQSITKKEIDLVIESFAVYNLTLPSTAVWGEISIPSQNLTWKTRSDTVNADNSVYHYPTSVYPGFNGTIGFLGHHTMYSAPFARIDQLKNDDQLIINDYLTQKTYTYQVTSVGDIKWDYKTNPIQFPLGSPDLTLVTCWPPGSDRGAFMVHAHLKSVGPFKN